MIKFHIDWIHKTERRQAQNVPVPMKGQPLPHHDIKCYSCPKEMTDIKKESIVFTVSELREVLQQSLKCIQRLLSLEDARLGRHVEKLGQYIQLAKEGRNSFENIFSILSAKNEPLDTCLEKYQLEDSPNHASFANGPPTIDDLEELESKLSSLDELKFQLSWDFGIPPNRLELKSAKNFNEASDSAQSSCPKTTVESKQLQGENRQQMVRKMGHD